MANALNGLPLAIPLSLLRYVHSARHFINSMTSLRVHIFRSQLSAGKQVASLSFNGLFLFLISRKR